MGNSRRRNKERLIEEDWEITRDRIVYMATSPWRMFKAICFGVGLTFMLTTIGVGVYAAYFVSTLPDVKAMSFTDLKKVAKKKVRKAIDKPKLKHHWVGIDNISRDMIYATTMAEDDKYFEHDGVNYDAILRAMAQNYKKKKFVVGGSTITQQVVKNLFFSPEKSISRKLREMLVAQDLTEHFKKNEVMELYLNIAEFGPNIFGIQAAAWHYFHKKPSKISADEAAFMTLMLPSPRKNHYSIFVKRNMTKRRWTKMRRIFRGMLSKEYISLREYQVYMKRKNYFKYAPKVRALSGE